MDQYMANQKEREKNNAFMHYTHISVDLVEKDHALTSMEIFPEGLNPFGMVHGGLLDTMEEAVDYGVCSFKVYMVYDFAVSDGAGKLV